MEKRITFLFQFYSILEAFWVHTCFKEAPLGHPGVHLGRLKASLDTLGDPFWLPLAPLGAPFASLWLPLGSILAPFWTPWPLMLPPLGGPWGMDPFLQRNSSNFTDFRDNVGRVCN